MLNCLGFFQLVFQNVNAAQYAIHLVNRAYTNTNKYIKRCGYKVLILIFWATNFFLRYSEFKIYCLEYIVPNFIRWPQECWCKRFCTVLYKWYLLAHLLVPDLLTNETYTNRINREFDDIAPWEFHYPREPKALSRQISTAFKHFYLKDQPVSNQTEKGIGDVSLMVCYHIM